ncbi:alpha/beta fold hydrolase [Chachezhania antarctica]|uniref:alpha/beta fold hydrolase n=1 Tax=Chachezhania antarctica TaxID=2340860 RepID=UPI000EB2B734|nr:alpha/beta fold hydrolase [Chachezhania antarctica]|tara:strand:- start:1870 stop:2586 length:717 start_codon:yes stop_codon:yes gene_type:complete
MTDFLLVHGACHGAWCWADLLPELLRLGHTARAIDLPGMGEDTTPIDDITLASSAQAVVSVCSPKTLVVGHSWGGLVAAEAAGMAPGCMTGLVLLATYVPLPGHSLADLRQGSPRPASSAALRRSEDKRTVYVGREDGRTLFYNTCRPSAQDYALDRLCPQPVVPQLEKAALGEGYDAVPKSFILTKRDHTILPDYQRQMAESWPPERMYEMDTDHSPFLSDPAGLAAILHRIAGEEA